MLDQRSARLRKPLEKRDQQAPASAAEIEDARGLEARQALGELRARAALALLHREHVVGQEAAQDLGVTQVRIALALAPGRAFAKRGVEPTPAGPVPEVVQEEISRVVGASRQKRPAQIGRDRMPRAVPLQRPERGERREQDRGGARVERELAGQLVRGFRALPQRLEDAELDCGEESARLAKAERERAQLLRLHAATESRATTPVRASTNPSGSRASRAPVAAFQMPTLPSREAEASSTPSGYTATCSTASE